ncbi:MAG: EamA family transporter, partial [Candidatus Moranbacteria bacterium]|nr:EamA family transporter [Candidatus Moranbacteria bacterium]
FFSFFSSLSAIFYLKSLKVKNISLSAILISSSALISTPLGIIFFSESITLTKFFGILLILSAVFIAKFRNPIFEKNHIFGLIAGIMFGVAYVVDKGIVQHIHPLIYIFWSFLMISILGFLIGFQNVINSLKNRKLPSFKFLIFSGIGYFLFNLFTFKAYRVGGEVGRIDAINTAYIFIIIIFEYFILKHTRGITRKLIASALAALGVFILGNL